MRNKAVTKAFYIEQLGFTELGNVDFPEYLMIAKDTIQIHFFLFETIDPKENYGQIYVRTNDIQQLYNSLKSSGVVIHPNGDLQIKPWMQKEFSILDPDNNLITFGQSV